MALTPQENDGFMQPFIEPTFANAYDIRNSLHQSKYYFMTGQVLRVGAQHPDDKKKGVYQWFDQQMIYLVEDFRQESLQVDSKHYPGQLTVPKSTTEKYKEDKKEVCMTGFSLKKKPILLQVKRKHELKQRLIEKKRDHLLTSIDIAEEDAFVCEVPGWNNQTYIDTVEAMRQAQPYASPRAIGGGGAARSPNVARFSGGAARSPGNVGQITGGMARARITEMEDSD